MTGSGRGLLDRMHEHRKDHPELELVYALSIAVGVRDSTAGLSDDDTVEGKVLQAARESLHTRITCDNGTFAGVAQTCT